MKIRSSLPLKANRLLGAALVQNNLIALNDLETANEHFIQKLQTTRRREVSLLKILVYDLQTLNEEDLISYQMDKLGLGYFRLSNYAIDPDLMSELDLEMCWSTWTLPVDHVEGFWFVNTSYYLSPVVRSYWEDTLDDTIIWSVTDLAELREALEGSSCMANEGIEEEEDDEEEEVLAMG